MLVSRSRGDVQGVDLLLDPLLEVMDRRIVLINSAEQQPGQEAVVLGEAAGQRFGQVGSADLQPASEQHQSSRVGHPRHQCGEDPAAGNPAQVADHTGQLDLGVFEQLLQPLHLPGAVPRNGGPGPGQIAEFPDRRRRYQRGPNQPVRAKVSQPLGVSDVGLAPGHRLGLAGVDQRQRKMIFKQVVERLPVAAGRLDHHHADAFCDQHVPQRQDLAGGRPPGGNRGPSGARSTALDADTHLDITLGHIQTRATRMNNLH